ncbi:MULTISPECIES: hypothetical protein [unclassified Streptomyces]|uniref:hypothetical protein n=1 Tax=unclassified Streptomyces TaxID=2593676 RepID=UPI000BF14507|nr:MULTISPECIES: hypothetical protein [unclassified Streptomyces]
MSVVFFLFVIAATFLVVSLVGPYRLYWRARPRAAGQQSDAALAVGRVAAFGFAGVFLFGACSVLDGVDKESWSAGEVREAAEKVPCALSDEPRLPGSSADGYASLIEAEFMRAGEGQGPSYAVSVERVGGAHDYEVSAGGADSSVCLHVTETKSADGGVFVPGANGDSSNSLARYDLTTTVDDGPC